MAGPTEVTIEITTLAEVMEFSNLPAPQPPKITLDGNALPTPSSPPGLPSGFQVVVFDPAQDITQPAAIVSNEYQIMIQVDNQWGSWYQYMYENIIRQILTSGNVQQQLVVIASFGLDANAPPTNTGCERFLDLGADSQLQSWINGVDAGSQGGDYLCGFPANYILVGNPSLSYGDGSEVYEAAVSGQSSVTTTLSVTVGNSVTPPS